jgi:Porin subfamily
MTLIKSILLGSAAGIVAVASAQAADLPTKKAAPVEYVRVCNVGGITGWTLPGSDTCVKLSGYMTAQFEGGNLNTQYNYGSLANAATALGNPVVFPGTTIPVGGAGAGTATVTTSTGATATVATGAVSPAFPFNNTQLNQRVLIANSAGQANTEFFRNTTGWTTRANFGFDLASNTAYGPLIAHFDLNSENGNGFDNTGNQTYLNTGYVTWAGITAGKAASFYSFTGGGDNWANFASPDQKGFNEPDLLAYTASFGGGFSATIAAQSPGTNGGSGSGTDVGGPNFGNIGVNSGTASQISYGGQKWPDFVGALHVKQGWGEAQLSGVLHNVDVSANGYNSNSSATGDICGLTGAEQCNFTHTQVGWGIDAGVKVNIPQMGAGDNFLVTGSYTQSAVWYSGLPDMMWGENGQVNGNGQPMFMQDAYFNPLTNTWAKPTAWSVSALVEHHFTPAFYIDLEGSVGQLKWGNQSGGCQLPVAGCFLSSFANGALSPSATTWLIGADIGWMPVTNLNFDLELMYQSTNQQTPSGVVGTIYNWGQANQFLAPGAWEGNSSGFAGRFRITRYF